MYRPQFPMLPAPPGYQWQPCAYEFDVTNTPAFANLTLATGQETGHIPLPLDHDAPFLLLAIKVQNKGCNILLRDPYGNELSDGYAQPAEYADEFQPPTVLEGPGIMCVAGSVFEVRLQGQ